MTAPPQKVVHISDKILLGTRDVLTPTGTLRSIEYELDVQKNKVVVFEIDFTGSVNLQVRGTDAMAKRTTAEPFTKTLVAVVDVKDPTKGWALETKYTWLEENPNTVLPGQSKREKLSEGVYVVTSRSERISPSHPDMFTYEVQVDKNATVRVTLDASQSTNLELKNVGGKVATVVVPPFSSVVVGTLAVVNPKAGYTLKTKWNWSETLTGSNVTTTFQHQQLSPHTPPTSQPDHRRGVADEDFYARLPPGTNRLPLVPAPVPAPSATTAPPLRGPGIRVEEISPGVTLTTETREGTWDRPTEILYHLHVDKPTNVDFTADFSGSANLRVVSGGSSPPPPSFRQPNFSPAMVVSASVKPYQTAVVARLQCVDPALGWKLICKYRWEEEDVSTPPPRYLGQGGGSGGAAATLGNTNPIGNSAAGGISPSRHPAVAGSASSLNVLLTRLGMEAYIPTFQQEDLTLDLLRIMARDEAEFRHSLQVLGISKMGHREKILLAVKQSV